MSATEAGTTLLRGAAMPTNDKLRAGDQPQYRAPGERYSLIVRTALVGVAQSASVQVDGAAPDFPS
jgi:hypothetical protein